MTYPVTEDGQTVGRILADLGRDVATLIRQELTLAKCELAEKADEAKGGATKFGAGAGMCLASVLTIAAAAVLGLTLLLSNWMQPLAAAAVSAVIVSALFGLAGYLLMKSAGEQLSPDHFKPQRTMDSLKENTQWARKQI